MTVKSSEVLRLAAEYALENNHFVIHRAALDLGYEFEHYMPWEYSDMIGCHWARSADELSLALCLAAAIAESEGD